MSPETNYTLESDQEIKQLEAPSLDYKPQLPKNYRPKIGLIGCGGITIHHLNAYKTAGLDIVGLCDLNEPKMHERRDSHYPNAICYQDYNELLANSEIDVVDIALHPAPRVAVIEAALNAGKHVLSQKPFALDLNAAERLAKLAESKNLKLAVNQNGRWAPYVRYMQQAINAGLIGETNTVNIYLNWDHTWIQGTPFETIRHIILYDFAVHWVDMAVNFFPTQSAERAFGTVRKAKNQALESPLIGGATIQFSNGVANLAFDGQCSQGALERIVITGDKGVLTATGAVTKIPEVTLQTVGGIATAQLEGSWFDDGFQGAMLELLCAIEDDREPFNSAQNNLATLASVYAIIASADSGKAIPVGENRQLGKNCQPRTSQ